MAIETAVVTSVLVLAFGGLMEIVHAAYVSDTMGRAARAAARAIALVPEAGANQGTLGSIACTAIRRELDLNEGFDCGSSWTLTVDTGLTPKALLQGQNPGDSAGDMVMVRIAWTRELWDLARPVNADERETPRVIAVGVARAEPEMGA